MKSTLEDTQTDLNYILNCYFELGVLDQPLSIEVRLQSTHTDFNKIIMHTKCITAVRQMNVCLKLFCSGFNFHTDKLQLRFTRHNEQEPFTSYRRLSISTITDICVQFSSIVP